MNDVTAKARQYWTPTPAELIGDEIARLCRGLGTLLRQRFADDPAPVANAVRFLDERGIVATERANGGTDLRSRCITPPGPLARLIESLRLQNLEVNLLLLAGMAEHHEGFADIFRMLHPSREPYPTVGLAAQLFCSGDDDRLELCELLNTGALVRAGALLCTGDAPMFARGLGLAGAVWTILQGGDALPADLPVVDVHTSAAGLQQWLSLPACAWAANALADDKRCTVVVVADNDEVAFHRGLALCAQSGRRARPLALTGSIRHESLAAIRLYCAMVDAVPVMRVECDSASRDAFNVLGDMPAPAVVCSRFGHAPQLPDRPAINIQAERLSVAASRAMWAELLPELEADNASLAALYPVEPYQAASIERDVRFRQVSGKLTQQSVAECFRNLTASGVSGSIEVVRPVSNWHHLVLPQQQIEQLEDAVRRLFQQSVVLDDWGFLAGRRGARGVRMLFSGPPGTGKTLAAEVLARAIDVDLLIVDLSKVVSKWIGETEKNLAEVFNEAERTRTVLFFDEADALFGKRTEVSDAHDRYANLETSYLLTRLERFEGLTILATNFRRNIDAAFVRRLDYIVEFREPSVEDRERLWRCHIPANAPVAGDVDLAEIARLFPIVGGQIRNAALSAAHFAAHEQGAIERAHLIRGIRREYDKAGKAFRELAVK